MLADAALPGSIVGAPAIPEFVAQVTRRSRGKLKVEVRTRARDTDEQRRVIQRVAAGRVDLGWAEAHTFDTLGVTSLRPLLVPLLIDSYQLQAQVLRRHSAQLSGRRARQDRGHAARPARRRSAIRRRHRPPHRHRRRLERTSLLHQLPGQPGSGDPGSGRDPGRRPPRPSDADPVRADRQRRVNLAGLPRNPPVRRAQRAAVATRRRPDGQPAHLARPQSATTRLAPRRGGQRRHLGRATRRRLRRDRATATPVGPEARRRWPAAQSSTRCEPRGCARSDINDNRRGSTSSFTRSVLCETKPDATRP